MVTVSYLDAAVIFLFILNSALGKQSCDNLLIDDEGKQCPPTFTCIPIKDSDIGFCECLPGHTKVNETFCEKLNNNSTPKSSSLVDTEDDSGSGHVVAGILIPTFLIMVVICGVYFNRRYHLVDYVTSKLYQRNNNYDEVMIGQDLEDDDPPLH